MRSLELFSSYRSQLLHQKQDYVGDVALNELIDEAWSLDLVENGVDFVRLGSHILEYVVYF